MPNISTCDTQFIKNTIGKSDKAVAVAWSESANMNELVEKVSELESAGLPVFILDLDSCGKVAEEFSVKPGDAVIFEKGREVSRIVPTGNVESDLAQIKQIAGK